jgi:putative membrane protein
MELLSEEERTQIEQAVARLERRTAAEFVVACVPKSANYAELRALVTGCWTLAAALMCMELLPETNPLWIVIAELPAALLLWMLLGWPPLHRRLIPPGAAERAVQTRAFELFSERGVHRTRDGTGILLLISELERRVTVLGDHAVHALVGPDGWQKHIDHLIGRVREHKTAQGVLEVMAELEALLAKELPPRSDDENELPNAVVRRT